MTAVIPETPEQLEEAFHDETKMQGIFAEGNFGKFMHAYVGAFVNGSKEDLRAHKEKMQVDFQDFMRIQAERNGARPPEGWQPGQPLVPVQGRGPRRARAAARSKLKNATDVFDAQGLFSPTAVGAAEDIDSSDYANDLKSFVWATIKGAHVAARDGDSELLDKMQALKGSLAKALDVRNAGSMAERIPSEGGFLVPETLRSEILALGLEEGVMRPYATVIPMDSLRVPIPSIDDVSHTSSVFGGVSAAWTAEGAALTATAPKFGRVILQANKLTAFTSIPNELLQDSISPMDVWFRTFFPMAVSFFEDLAFLMGDGVDQPEGLLNGPGAVTVDPAVSGKIGFGDIVSMLSRLWPPSLKRARWVCSPDALAQILQMVLVSGSTPVAPPLMLANMLAIDAPGGSDGSGINYRLFGLPLRVTEKAPFPVTDGSQPDGGLTLYDPTGYLIGDRQAMQVATSADYNFANDEVSYRITQRLDGRSWQRSPLAPANGSPNKLSMTVKLGQTHS